MIKYSEAEKVLAERIKKVQTSVVCDKCGKEIVAKKRPDNWDWSTQKYFNVTTGHNCDACDWWRLDDPAYSDFPYSIKESKLVEVNCK